jgi:hypothetical protein
MINEKRALLLTFLLLLCLGSGCGARERNEMATPTATAIPFTVILPTNTVPPPETEEPDAEPATTAVVTTTQVPATSVPTLAAPVGVLNVPKTGGEDGGRWTLVDLRYGLHADRLRIVWEFAEPGQVVPKYRAVEVDNAAAPPTTGDVTGLGVARIDLLLNGVQSAAELDAKVPIEFEENPGVTRMVRYPTADETRLGFSIGLLQPVKFEVYELSAPVRIVLDVLYP